MTYECRGAQYVVVAAGGYPDAGVVAPGDTLVAFRLPRADETGRSLWSRRINRPGGRSRALLFLALLSVWQDIADCGHRASHVVSCFSNSISLWRASASVPEKSTN